MLGTISAYIIGIISHRLGHYLNTNLFKKISRKVFDEDLIRENWDSTDYLKVLQNGSDKIVERLIYIESLIKIFKISGFYLFFIGCIMPFWLGQQYVSLSNKIFITVIFIGFGVASFLCLGLQVKRRKSFLTGFKEIES